MQLAAINRSSSLFSKTNNDFLDTRNYYVNINLEHKQNKKVEVKNKKKKVLLDNIDKILNENFLPSEIYLYNKSNELMKEDILKGDKKIFNYLNMFKELNEIASLTKENYDEDFEPISTESISNAKQFLTNIYFTYNIKMPYIVPTRRKTVQFEFYKNDDYLEVEFFDNFGTIFKVENEIKSFFKVKDYTKFLDLAGDLIEQFNK